jgi:hypothetical protein
MKSGKRASWTMEFVSKVVIAGLLVAAPVAASAADFGRVEEAPPLEAFAVPVPPVLYAPSYNDLYEMNGVIYAPPYPLPYFGLFPQWGPNASFYPQPDWYVPGVAHRGRHEP